MSKRNHNVTKFIKKCWMPLAILIITLAILFSVFRALTPWARQYKGQVEQHLSALIGQPVTISNMETSWYWFEPVLKLNQVTVSDAHDHVLKLDKLLVGINLFSSLWHWEIQPGILYIDDVHLTVRHVQDQWQVDGIRQDKRLIKLEPDAYLPVLSWLLTQQKIIIKRVSIFVHLNDGTVLPLDEMNLTVVNRFGHYRIKGSAKLAQTTPTELSILADMHIDPYRLSSATGHAWLSVRHLLPAQWTGFFPNSSIQLKAGQGDLELWLDVAKGHLANMQTTFHFKQLAWMRQGKSKTHFIQSIQANLAWKPNVEGWLLSGDHIKLRADGRRWPDNKLVLDYKKSKQTYRLFLENILLSPMLSTDVDWPEAIQPILAYHPHGELHDTQVEIKDRHVDFVLTRFSQLGWQAVDSVAGMSNLSGVVNWQPMEGRLDLDAKNAVMAPKALPPVKFKQINGTVDWKELSHGLRVSMDRLVLEHSELVLSARGALDKPLSPSGGLLRLEAEFSAADAQQWLPYLPSAYLKPKLDAWLKNDIKRIAKASGQLKINGALADIPFDKEPGVFTLTTHLSGVDLFINKQWPLNQNIDAWLRFDKRAMQADIHHAELQGILVDQMNLRMDDIGLDRETLLIHGKIEAPAKKIKAYVFNSPLRKKLSRLQPLDLEGPLGLDLNLEIPLYPENHEVLVRGVMGFNNNQAVVHYGMSNLALDNLYGTLQFDEHGITDSTLRANLFDELIAMHIKTVRQKKPYTEIRVDGDTSIDALKKKLDLPVFSLLKGRFNIASTLTLTDEPDDLDHIQINTTLQGVSFDLPSPLGKSFEVVAPLTIDIDFNPATAIRTRFNYDNRLSGDLWFDSGKKTFHLNNGEIRLGPGKVSSQKKAGVHVVGTLPVFDLQKWQKTIAKVPTDTSSPRLIDNIRFIDVLLGSVIIKNHEYKQVKLNAVKSAKDSWEVKLNQEDVKAHLHYNHAQNWLSGNFEYLYLAKSVFTNKKTDSLMSNLTPSQIPNLDLTIDKLRVGEVDVGSVDLKSTSTSTNWQLQHCQITSPVYQLTMKGGWVKNSKQNQTKLQADLQIENLSKSLHRLNIPPVVEAHQGKIQFKGGWPGGIHDYSLAKIRGELYIIFKNGRITNLSPETEGKLGLGKLLSILSLQTIPRRLQLDFSDLANDGYSFDVFKGSFVLKNGVMITDDSFVDGPVAHATMKGSLNIVKRLYDVDLQISPHITASLPVVATIAGGPIAGVATWLASKLINRGMHKISGYTYKVSGPWLDPVVQQVSIIKKPR